MCVGQRDITKEEVGGAYSKDINVTGEIGGKWE